MASDARLFARVWAMKGGIIDCTRTKTCSGVHLLLSKCITLGKIWGIMMGGLYRYVQSTLDREDFWNWVELVFRLEEVVGRFASNARNPAGRDHFLMLFP